MVVGAQRHRRRRDDSAASYTIILDKYHREIGCLGHAGTCTWRIEVNGVRRTDEVNARRARLVRGWATVVGLVCHLGM